MRIRRRDGSEVRGYAVFRWLETQAGAHADATVIGLDLENQETAVPITELDFSGPMEAYAYTSEKIFYLRTNLVENFPDSSMQLLRSKMENVPDVSAEYLRLYGGMLEDLVKAIREEGGEVTEFFAGQSQEDVKRLLARMIAFDNARAMLDIGKVLPRERVFSNPMEPTRMANVVLLKRNREDPSVAERLSLSAFMSALLLGETPDKKREIAYNAYRATDDEEENAYIAGLEREARGGELFRVFERKRDVPETLREEFELFRVMHRACRCYALNTTLTADPDVKDRKEAVGLTINLIARLIDQQPEELRLTLRDYRAFISEPPERTAVSPKP